MIRGEDGKIRYPPHWLPDFRADFKPLDDMVHKPDWKWLLNWWYRRSWSKIYSAQGVMVTRLGYLMIYEILKRGSMEYRRFTALLFQLQKKMEEEGMNPRIPFMWGWPDMWSTSELAEMGVFVIG